MSIEPTREEINAAASEHLSLVRAMIRRRLTGDTSALRLWHEVHGTVRLLEPTHPISDEEYAAKLSEVASRHFARTSVGAAIVTQMLAMQLSLAVGRPPDALLAELEARAHSGFR